MSTLYVIEEYAILKKHQQRLKIEKDGNTLLELPFFKIDKILLFGNIQITGDAIQYLLENDIDVSFYNIYGKLKGRLVNKSGKNIFLRIQQYENYIDDSKRLKIAKWIVEGKIKNFVAFLKKFQRNHDDVDFENEIKSLEKCLLLLERKEHIGGILGIEGVATSIYFNCFKNMIISDEMKNVFSRRERRPPKDPVNSLLSLGYSLITNEMWGIIEGIGFEPFIGFLHGINYGRPSLALDLIEQFRVSIVDRVVLEMINHKVINQEDFEFDDVNGCRMKKESLKKFFYHFDRRLNTTIKLSNDEEITYRKLFFNQTYKFVNTILEGKEYKSFIYV